MPSTSAINMVRPHTESQILALLANNDRKTAVARMDAFMDFMHDNDIDPEEDLTYEQTIAWQQREAEVLNWSHERRLAILALAEVAEQSL